MKHQPSVVENESVSIISVGDLRTWGTEDEVIESRYLSVDVPDSVILL